MTARIWIPAISILVGVAVARFAPSSWGIAPFHGGLLGAALFLAVFRKRAGAVPRAAAFVALAAIQAYVLFVLAPGADLRATFVILSTWIVIESVAGRPVGTMAPERSRSPARPASGY